MCIILLVADHLLEICENHLRHSPAFFQDGSAVCRWPCQKADKGSQNVLFPLYTISFTLIILKFHEIRKKHVFPQFIARFWQSHLTFIFVPCFFFI